MTPRSSPARILPAPHHSRSERHATTLGKDGSAERIRLSEQGDGAVEVVKDLGQVFPSPIGVQDTSELEVGQAQTVLKLIIVADQLTPSA
jgi:hypothetical protein